MEHQHAQDKKNWETQKEEELRNANTLLKAHLEKCEEDLIIEKQARKETDDALIKEREEIIQLRLDAEEIDYSKAVLIQRLVDVKLHQFHKIITKKIY